MSNGLRFSSVEKQLLRKIRRTIGRAPIRLVLGKEEGISPSETAPVASVVIRNRWTLLRLLLNPGIGFGEAYREGRIEVEGDLVALLEAVYRCKPGAHLDNSYSRLMSRWLEWTQANTTRGSRRNIHHHYDIGTDFYKLWLDSQLVYTCAYFPSPDATLEEAQFAKMDHVCRKLQLRPGESIVEAGCGWGGLALHMAKYYGVFVKAFNISHDQILFARKRAEEERLNGQVEYVEDDYRNISGRFDVFVSVGMLEHVGREHYAEQGRVIRRSIGEGGRGLLHFIGRNFPNPLNVWSRKRIFPGGYAPTLRQVMQVFEPWDFSVLDVENLRLHYAKTLEHWLDRFERSAHRVAGMFGPEFVRTWRLYLAGSQAAFRSGALQLFQILFAGPACQQIPWTRAHWYAKELEADQESQWIHAIS